jgi:hypothetical protein
MRRRCFSRSWHTEAKLDRIKHSAIFQVTALHIDFATGQRKVLPTVIGRMPPSFSFWAQSKAPQKTGFITAGSPPDRHRLANSRDEHTQELASDLTN